MIHESLREFLYLKSPALEVVGTFISKEVAIPILLPVILIALICEHLSSMQYKAIIQKTFVALIALFYFVNFHQTAVNMSFDLADKIVQKQKINNFMKIMKTGKERSIEEDKIKQPSQFNMISKVVAFFKEDLPSFTIWTFTAFALIILKQFYSLVYHFAMALMPLGAVLSILPITKNSLAGIIKTSIWCILMPLVVALVLIFMDNLISTELSKTGYLINSFEGLLNLSIVVITLLMTPLLTIKLIDGQGLAHVAEKVASMTAMSTMLAMPNYLKNQTKKHFGNSLNNILSTPDVRPLTQPMPSLGQLSQKLKDRTAKKLGLPTRNSNNQITRETRRNNGIVLADQNSSYNSSSQNLSNNQNREPSQLNHKKNPQMSSNNISNNQHDRNIESQNNNKNRNIQIKTSNDDLTLEQKKVERLYAGKEIAINRERSSKDYLNAIKKPKRKPIFEINSGRRSNV